MLNCPSCGAKLTNEEKCVACGHPVRDSFFLEPAVDLIGHTVDDKFFVESTLGEGAMGTVYRARQVSLDKAVALKVLHRHLAGDSNIVKRFHREALAASRFDHPNSVKVLDFGQTAEGTLYIAMEFVQGTDLYALLQQSFPIPLRRIVHLIGQVCDALEEAHAAGIVHRDLKPENIMIIRQRDGSEHVKVCDFGIAKIQDSEEALGETPLTLAGIVCGTPAYMSPEQCRGEPLDGRADLYSVGVILYQLTTRALPFVAETALGVVSRQINDRPVPPTELQPDLPETGTLEPIILKALEKDRQTRYQTARQLKQDLEAVSAGPLLSPSPLFSSGRPYLNQPERIPSQPQLEKLRRGRMFWVGAAAALAIFAGVAVATQLRPAAGTSEDAGSAGARRSGESSNATDPSTGRKKLSLAIPVNAPEETPSEDGGVPDGGQAKARTHKGGGTWRRGRATRSTDSTSQPATTDRFLLGSHAFKAGDIDEAIRHFEAARQKNPQRAEIYRMLGKCYYRVGKTRLGRDAYRRYLQLQPQAQDRAFIESILSTPSP